MNKKVLVTGATGQVASYAIPQLVEKGVSVRAYVHHAQKAGNLRKLGVEIIEGEFSEESKLSGAASGMDTVLSINTNGADSIINGDYITKAARVNNVPHLVRLSAIKAAPDAPTGNGRNHFKTDSDIIASGLTYTILRPNFFMQNLMFSVPTIKEQGKMYWGMGQGRLSMIDVRDVADCLVSVILNKGHENKIYDPNGPESISFFDIADIISDELDRTVTYVPVSPEEVRQSLKNMGADDWGAQLMMDYSIAYSKGWGDISNNDTELLTGHKARSFRQFFEEVMSGAFKQYAH